MTWLGHRLFGQLDLAPVPQDRDRVAGDDAGVTVEASHHAANEPRALAAVTVIPQQGAGAAASHDERPDHQPIVESSLEPGVQNPTTAVAFRPDDLHPREATQPVGLLVAAQDPIARHREMDGAVQTSHVLDIDAPGSGAVRLSGAKLFPLGDQLVTQMPPEAVEEGRRPRQEGCDGETTV